MSKRTLAVLLTAALCISALAGCEKRPERVEFTTFAMDTVINFTLYGSRKDCSTVQSVLTDRLAGYEDMLSVTKEDSFVYAVNHANGEWVEIPDDDILALLCSVQGLGLVTGGALDFTAYPAVKAWGFTSGEHRVPSDEELVGLAEKIDYTAVKLDGNAVALPQGMEIDLGAVAKGWAGDQMWKAVKENGVSSALLDLGQSTIVAVGTKPEGNPWRIGVVDPAQPGNYFAVVELADMAMGTSGGYQRYFEQDGEIYWHILDPDTAAPARSGLSSVTVIAPSAFFCDGLSTALFVMGLEEGVQFWRNDPNFEAIFVTEEGKIYRTAGLEGRFSLAEGYTDREVVVLE